MGWAYLYLLLLTPGNRMTYTGNSGRYSVHCGAGTRPKGVNSNLSALQESSGKSPPSLTSKHSGASKTPLYEITLILLSSNEIEIRLELSELWSSNGTLARQK
ncbi:hypothetical protein GYMLUDRAFT_92664 [Collybiopsis luxurians FD-317 M1]|nr:hypothetical protein GYMLUDRAFT_92664 [Collybiopsis luxurians FD-317 M1]